MRAFLLYPEVSANTCNYDKKARTRIVSAVFLSSVVAVNFADFQNTMIENINVFNLFMESPCFSRGQI